MYNENYWKERIKYYLKKYGKNSIEVKSAKLNLKRIKEIRRN